MPQVQRRGPQLEPLSCLCINNALMVHEHLAPRPLCRRRASNTCAGFLQRNHCQADLSGRYTFQGRKGPGNNDVIKAPHILFSPNVGWCHRENGPYPNPIICDAFVCIKTLLILNVSTPRSFGYAYHLIGYGKVYRAHQGTQILCDRELKAQLRFASQQS